MAWNKLERQATALGMTLAEYLKALEVEHKTVYRMAIAAGVYPHAIQHAQKRVAKQQKAEQRS